MKTICRFIIAAGLILLAVAVPAEAVGKIPAISAYQEQCMALEMKGNYGEAEKLYTQALVDYPTYTHFMVRRGEAYLHLGETQKAANDFTRALALDDKCGMAVLGQATMYALAGDDAALQAGIFQLQYELLHYLDMPRAEKQAKDAVLYRTGKLGRAGEYH